MSKKKAEQAPVKVKRKGAGTKVDVLKVSKEVKIMAAFASLRGFSKRQFIRVMGEAEDNYKKNGRLVFGG